MVNNTLNYLLLLSMNVVVVSLCGMWIMYFPLYASEHLKLSSELIGLLYTLSSATPMLGSFIGGFVADVVGKKKAILMGFAASLMSLIAMMTGYIMVIELGFVMYFFGIAFLSPAVSVLILESSPRKVRGTLYMIAKRVVPSLPPLVTLPLAGYLYENGMYTYNILIGIIGLLLAATMTCFVKESGGSAKRDLISVLIWLRDLVLNDRVFLVLVITFGLNWLFIEGLEWYIPIYLKSIGFSAVEYGLTMGLASVAIAIGALASGALVDRLGPRMACVVGWVLAAIASLLFIATPFLSLPMLLAWKVIGLLPEATPPTVIAQRYRENKTIALSSFNTAASLISVIGPVTIGFIAAYHSSAPFILRALILLISSLLIYKYLR